MKHPLPISNQPNSRRVTPQIVVIGKESVGKSQLIASLTGERPEVSNLKGTTLACSTYRWGERTLIDTPGIERQSDSVTTRDALQSLAEHDTVILVAAGTHLDDDLKDLWPLVAGKQGIVVVTFIDRVVHVGVTERLEELSQHAGVSFVGVDARAVSAEQQERLRIALTEPAEFSKQAPTLTTGWRVEPPITLLDRPWIGPLLAISLLLGPATFAVWFANTVAQLLDPIIAGWLKPLVAAIQAWPASFDLFKSMLAGQYGLVTMGPLLFVWAAPTIVLYAFLLAAYKASGLIDRLNIALHPLARPFGLSGRDIVRVVMGFGCNVPAVISTRSCSSCTRGSCISAIAFGSACSYQFPATLAVFAAVGRPWLVWPYLGYLLVTTLIYLRLTSPRDARSALNLLIVDRRHFLEWPRASSLWREARDTLRQFFFQALPIFFAITLIASVLGWSGLLDRAAAILQPLMSMFRLPAEAALPVLLASIRKDGILLFAGGEETGSMAAAWTATQVLTAVYLAGVLLPCLVTALTIAREQSWRFAGKLLIRQALAASAFAAGLAWCGQGMGW
ncbi:MAG: ferrous iron transporter B [Planctomycetes bacterium]|nr:ferrous iron transporter B [Planctomycetota bacterium]